MTKVLKVAVVGRPNVGKSALFNRICKKNISIVDEAEGITRDRLYADSDFFGTPFQIIDTGGIDAHSKAQFNEHIKRQAEIAIEEADSLIMVVDAHMGITTLDKEISDILHRTHKPVCLAVNKIDNMSQEHLMYQFSKLGISSMVAVSAAQGWHIAELLEAAFTNLSKEDAIQAEDNSIDLAIVGRANVGKSSLLNYLLDEERCIVSPIPGTTRDSIDVPFTQNGVLYNLIDTAGIRRKQAEHEVVDKFAAIRTERAIERADICLLMLDAQQGITREEKKIANVIEESGKGCILLFNKWDLVKGFRMEHCLQGIESEVPFLKHCPKIFMSALTGRNVDKIFPVIEQVHADSQKRISTGQLNKFIGLCLQKNHPPMIMGKRLRIYYMAQVGIQPPKFVVFVNFPNLMTETYRKYIYNQFREAYSFEGLPIEIYLKGKKRKDKGPGSSGEEDEFPHEIDGVRRPHEKNVVEDGMDDMDEADGAIEVDDMDDMDDMDGAIEVDDEEN
ncbi:MAG: ribosome biogenesis GTPase Der [Parachlamydiaceae bacterium]